MPRHSYWFGLLAIVIALIGHYGAAGAAAPQVVTQRHPPRGDGIIEPLMPDHNSLVQLWSVTLRREADGRRTLRACIKTPIGALASQCLGYFAGTRAFSSSNQGRTTAKGRPTFHCFSRADISASKRAASALLAS